LPLFPTLIVAAVIATMIGLGIWQLQRASWKEGLLARYESAKGLPAIDYPAEPTGVETLLYRRATGFCLQPVSRRTTAGRNLAGKSGWSYIVACRTGGGEGPGMIVDIGWSERHDATVEWRGGAVDGVIAPDKDSLIRLVAANSKPGLEPSLPPGPDAIANNHLLYAAQWFLFAALAGLIYWLALHKRGIKP